MTWALTPAATTLAALPEAAPVVLAAAAAAAIGLLMPALVAALPDPVDDPVDDPVETPAVDDAAPAVTAPAPPVGERYPRFAEVADGAGFRLACCVLGALVAGALAALLGTDWSLLWWVPLAPIGVALAVIDWRTLLLPTVLVRLGLLVAVVAMVVATIATGDLAAAQRAVIGALAVRAVYWLLWRIQSRWMGYGDVRLSALIGLVLGWHGWAELVLGWYAGFALGAVIAGALSVARVLDRKAYPFGPFMLAGALVGLWWGPALLPGLAAAG